MTYPLRLKMHLFGPICIGVLLLLNSSVQQLLGWPKAWVTYERNKQLLLFLIYPISSQVILQAFKCREILGTHYLVRFGN